MVPIGFGIFAANFPLTGLLEEGGLFYIFYHYGIETELIPPLIFLGLGAMTDFGPVIANPKTLLLGAALSWVFAARSFTRCCWATLYPRRPASASQGQPANRRRRGPGSTHGRPGSAHVRRSQPAKLPADACHGAQRGRCHRYCRDGWSFYLRRTINAMQRLAFCTAGRFLFVPMTTIYTLSAGNVNNDTQWAVPAPAPPRHLSCAIPGT